MILSLLYKYKYNDPVKVNDINELTFAALLNDYDMMKHYIDSYLKMECFTSESESEDCEYPEYYYYYF